MNKPFIVFIFLILAVFDVQALLKTKTLSYSMDEEAPKSSEADTKKAMAQSFSVKDFYEYLCYSEAYFLYNDFVLNKSLACGARKKQFWYDRKKQATSMGNFCIMVGKQVGGTYLPYIGKYILNTVNWFNVCS